MTPYLAAVFATDSTVGALLFALYLGAIERRVFYGLNAIMLWVMFAASVLTVWPGAFVWGGAAALYTYLWWKHRRKGGWKKGARELGEKSKARVQALVEQMTPSPIPSPVGGGS